MVLKGRVSIYHNMYMTNRNGRSENPDLSLLFKYILFYIKPKDSNKTAIDVA